MLFRLIRLLFFVFLVVVVIGFATRNYWLKWGLPYYIHHQSGLNLAAESVDFSQFYPPKLVAYEVDVRNPSDFPVEDALQIGKAVIEWPSETWSNQDWSADKVTLEIDRLTLVRKRDGSINLKELPVLQPAKFDNAAVKPLIGELELSLDEVVIIDQAGQNPGLPLRYRVDVQGSRHSQVRDRGALEAIILEEAVKRLPREQLPPNLLPDVRSEHLRIIDW